MEQQLVNTGTWESHCIDLSANTYIDLIAYCIGSAFAVDHTEKNCRREVVKSE